MFFVNLLSIVLLVNKGTCFARLIVTSLRIFAAPAKQDVHNFVLLMQYHDVFLIMIYSILGIFRCLVSITIQTSCADMIGSFCGIGERGGIFI